MDGSRFDELTRRAAMSRRGLLRALAGAAGAVLIGQGSVRAAPRCKRTGQRCQTTADCCPAENGNVCAADRTCQPCPATTPVLCGGVCLDTSSDSTNCGACGVRCGGGSTCAGGVCTCPNPSQDLCDGACVETTNNNQHCGGCGIRCTGGSTCAAGVCQCPSGTPSMCNGVCVDKSDDNVNCGACGVQCFGGSNCFNGGCRCAIGQHFDSSGRCTCLGTTCSGSGNASCCFGYVCDGSQCVTCTPTGAATGSASRCCTGAAANGICTGTCQTNAQCDASKGQVCASGVCRCPAGQQMTAGGTCVCLGTACGNRDDCCGGYVCNAAGTCETCKPAGWTLTSPSPDVCCGRVNCPAGEPNSLCVCVNACSSDSDCQPGSGQVCLSHGYCDCPFRQRPTFDGICVCDGAGCSTDDQCCGGYTCQGSFCRAA